MRKPRAKTGLIQTKAISSSSVDGLFFASEHGMEYGELAAIDRRYAAKPARVPSTSSAPAWSALVAIGRQLNEPHAEPVADRPHGFDSIGAIERRHGLALLVHRSVVDALHDL